MWAFAYCREIVLIAVLLLASQPAHAQEKKDDAKEPPKDLPTVVDYWQLDAGLGTQAAAHMIATGNVLSALGVRMLATADQSPLSNWRFVFDEPLPLDHRYLEAIKDRRPLPVIQTEVGKLLRKLPEWERPGSSDWGWYRAFNEALRRSDEADSRMFEKAAERNKEVVYAQLKARPEHFRGKIITISGKLIVIRKEPAPRLAPDNLEYIYTGYITGPTPGAPPFTVTFTQLPVQVEKPSEKLNLDVTFHGYFLSLILFQPEKGNKTQKEVISPYLVGKTLIVTPTTPTEPETAYSYYLIAWAVSGLLGVALIVAAMNVWFRRGDRQIQSRLAELRDKSQPFNIEPAEPENVVPLATPIPPEGQNGAQPPP